MRLLTVVVITIAVCASAFGVPQDPSSKQGSVDQKILSIEQEMLDALLKGDASASERYLADNYVFTGPDGMVQNKTQAIADMKSGDLKLQGATLDEAKVRVYGDTAVVTYGSKDKGTYKGKDISGNTRWTDVLVKRSGRWQVVASHGSRVAAQ
jgi:ketosteroid isomerase-like protein